MVRAVTAEKSSEGLAWAAVIWILLALTAAAGVISLSLTQVLLSFGLLLIVPLGLDSFRWSHDLADRLRTISYGMARITGPVAAISMMLPTGLARSRGCLVSDSSCCLAFGAGAVASNPIRNSPGSAARRSKHLSSGWGWMAGDLAVRGTATRSITCNRGIDGGALPLRGARRSSHCCFGHCMVEDRLAWGLEDADGLGIGSGRGNANGRGWHHGLACSRDKWIGADRAFACGTRVGHSACNRAQASRGNLESVAFDLFDCGTRCDGFGDPVRPRPVHRNACS